MKINEKALSEAIDSMTSVCDKGKAEIKRVLFEGFRVKFEEELAEKTVEVPYTEGCFEDCENVVSQVGPKKLTSLVKSVKIIDLPGTYTHEDALKEAEKRGLRLMTKEEIYLLIACGVLKPGSKSFWSSSVYAGGRNTAWIFSGNIGSIFYDYRSNSDFYSVRCVGVP